MKGKKGTALDTVPFNDHTIAAYRKIAANIDQLTAPVAFASSFLVSTGAGLLSEF